MLQNKFVESPILVITLTDDGRRQEIAAVDPVRQGDVAWYVFAYRGAMLHPDLVQLLQMHGNSRPDVDIFYGDEVVLGEAGKEMQYLCKPSFDRTYLLAQDYIGLPLAIRRRAMLVLEGPEASTGSAQLYDLLLRAVTLSIGVERITEVLAINPAQAPRASAADRLIALRRHMAQSQAECDILPGIWEGTFQLRRPFQEFPDVTLVIPTCQTLCPVGTAEQRARPMILNLLKGLSETGWPMEQMRVLVGDDIEDDTIYRSQDWPFQLERVVTARATDEPFNYARKVNRLWRAARTEYLIILNDDLVVREPAWMSALMTFAVDEGVGGVGARLLFPDGTIQHVGMPAGVLGPCVQAFFGVPGTRPTYQNWAAVHREWSIVTGAVFATRRSVLQQVNGFDERFTLNYNDVDLCLRLRQLGYRIVYTPHAELTHFESASRGRQSSPAEHTALFMEKWQSFLKDDPCYHPRLTRSTPDIRPVLDGDEWWAGISELPKRDDDRPDAR